MSTSSSVGLLLRARSILASSRGAFDMMSVIVAAAVIAVLVGGAMTNAFGVIPWVQDNGARQSLSAVNTAQGVAKVRDGKFMTGDGLTGASYLTLPGSSLAVGADTDGTCWVGFSRSDAGNTFFATADKADPQSWASGTNTGCVDVSQQKQLARAVGTPMPIAYGVNFGYNYNGEMGKGSTSISSTDLFEVNRNGVMAGKSITHVSRGGSFACAVADNIPYCWGANSVGQLGNGTTTPSLTPVAVDTGGVLAGKTITALTSGSGHTCVLADDEAFCWGSDNFGQLGSDATSTTSPAPVAVDGLLAGKKVSAIDAGSRTTCAIVDGAAYCWGEAGNGALGTNNAAGTVTLPKAVVTSGVLAGKTVTQISAGRDATCAVADARAYCWGSSSSAGRLGNNTTGTAYTPVAVDDSGVLAGKSVTAVSMGTHHACAVADGSLFCWGSSGSGALGNGSSGSILVPSAVPGPWGSTPVSAASAGDSSTCAVADGAAYCWGYNQYGQVGNGGTANVLTPVATNVLPAHAGKSVIAIATDYMTTSVVYE